MNEARRPSPSHPTRGGWARHWAEPLHRNGYYLAASSLATSALGLVFWTVAARMLEPDAVGLGAAAIAAMTFLANLSSFNMVNGLNRFVPEAGDGARRLVAATFVVVGAAGLVIATIYVLGIGIWSPTLATILDEPPLAAWFVVAVAAWSVFAVQDGALTGLRAAVWVPVENLTFAVAKIIVLVLLAASGTGAALFVAWTAPVVPIVVVVGLLLFGRLLPAAAAGVAGRVRAADVRRFASSDYAASLVWMAAVNLLPIVVLERSGADQAAYFYLAWTVAYTLYLVGRNFGMSLVTEIVRRPEATAELTFRTLRQGIVVVAPLAAVVVVAASPVLRLFGADYSEEGTGALRLFALATLPGLVTTTYTAKLRAERRMRRLILIMLSVSVAVLSLAWVLLPPLGIVGVGMAWLVTQTTVASGLLLTDLRSDLIAGLPQRWLEGAGAWRARLGRIGRRRADFAVSREVVASLPGGRKLKPKYEIASLSDSRTVVMGDDSGPSAVVKLTSSTQGRESLERAAHAMGFAHADDRLAAVRPLIPQVLSSGVRAGRAFVVESHMRGVPATSLGPGTAAIDATVDAVAVWASELARSTVDPRPPTVWFESRVEVIRARLVGARGREEMVARLDELATRLTGRLASVQSAMIHGDLWLGNVLVAGPNADVVGIVDWDAAHPAGPVDFDLVSLMLTSRVFRRRGETGSVVLELLGSPERWTSGEQRCLRLAHDLEWATSRDAVLVSWLHGAALNLEKSARYRPGSPWFVRNLQTVLFQV